MKKIYKVVYNNLQLLDNQAIRSQKISLDMCRDLNKLIPQTIHTNCGGHALDDIIIYYFESFKFYELTGINYFEKNI